MPPLRPFSRIRNALSYARECHTPPHGTNIKYTIYIKEEGARIAGHPPVLTYLSLNAYLYTSLRGKSVGKFAVPSAIIANAVAACS